MPIRSPSVSDSTSVFNAFALDGAGGGRRIEFENRMPEAPAGGFTWLDLNFGSPEVEKFILENEEIPEVATDLLLQSETRPGCFEFTNGLLVTLRGVNLNKGAHLEDMISVRVWVTEQGIISCRRRELQSVQAVVKQIESGKAPLTPGELLSDLIGELALRITHADEQLDGRLSRTEKPHEELDPVTRESLLSQLRRQTATLRRYLHPQKEALLRLQHYQGPLLNDEESKDIKGHTEQITQSLEDIELIREQAISYQDEHFNKMAMEQNARIYVLSIVTAVFLPLSFLTGLLGINVGGIPGANSPIGFISMVLICVLVAVCLLLYFRYKRWL